MHGRSWKPRCRPKESCRHGMRIFWKPSNGRFLDVHLQSNNQNKSTPHRSDKRYSSIVTTWCFSSSGRTFLHYFVRALFLESFILLIFQFVTPSKNTATPLLGDCFCGVEEGVRARNNHNFGMPVVWINKKEAPHHSAQALRFFSPMQNCSMQESPSCSVPPNAHQVRKDAPALVRRIRRPENASHGTPMTHAYEPCTHAKPYEKVSPQPRALQCTDGLRQ
mmetsp:Transcript_8763/g.53888  ORF Transcript_8763/g.53888 Transcript_8763/m.53888 type:complete len:221 (+) Transcript_8763:2259-2921(+)